MPSRRSYHRQRERARKRDGICRRCDLPVAETSRMYCSHHLEYFVSDQRERYRQRLAAGICVRCQLPAVPGLIMCAYHHDLHNTRRRNGYAATHHPRCSTCGESGHNRRTCPHTT